MVLVILIFLTSFGCLLVSLLALGLVVRHLYIRQETYKPTRDSDAILISGCDSGIGLELAKYFHKTCNFKIICCFLDCGSSGYRELLKLSTSNANSNGKLILKQLDLRSDKDIDDTTKAIDNFRQSGKFKNLIAVINNAGTMTYGEFDWLTWNQIQTQIEINLIGTLKLTRATVPYIIESRGRFINVSSVNDTTVFPGLSIYSATKSALSTFSRGLGFELRKFGAHVVTVRLGDFARLTNIMAKHEAHRDDMWNDMSSKKKTMYKDYFNEFNRHLMRNYGMTSPKDFEESSLFKNFKLALLSKSPPTTITCAPLAFRIFYSVIELTPVWMQYYIIDALIQCCFRWRPPKLVV